MKKASEKFAKINESPKSKQKCNNKSNNNNNAANNNIKVKAEKYFKLSEIEGESVLRYAALPSQ